MAAERRLERDPWVRRATVTRTLPRSVAIDVVERTPVAIGAVGGPAELLAGDGTALGPSTGSGLPRIATADPSGASGLAELHEGTAAAAAMPPALRSSVAVVTVEASGAIALQTRSGVTVTYGDGSQLKAKAQALLAVLAHAAATGQAFTSIDVSVPAAPTASTYQGTSAGAGRQRVP